MKKSVLFLFIVILFSVVISAQKIPLDHDVYDSWKSLSSSSISDDGKWVTYEINPQQGDGWLYICDIQSGRKDSSFCGFRAGISPESKYVVWQVKPTYGETREAKKKKLKSDQMPKNNLSIRVLPGEDVIEVERVKSYQIPESGSYWMAYLMEKKAEEKKDIKPGGAGGGKPDESKISGKKPPEPKGTELVIFNPVSGKKYSYTDVTDYAVAREGKSIAFLQVFPDTTKIDRLVISYFDTKKESIQEIFSEKGNVSKLTADKTGNNYSFIFTSDTSKVKVYDLYLSGSGRKAVRIVNSSDPAMPDGWSVSENTSLNFSDDARRLFFGTAEKPQKEPEDTLLDDEKYHLDIWSWNDPVLQPMQKIQLEREKRRNYRAVYHIDRNMMVQLAIEEIPDIRILQKGDNNTALGSSDLKYRKLGSWDVNRYADYYIINVENGDTKMILEKAASRVMISPDGKWVIYWDISRQWVSINVADNSSRIITSSIGVPLYNELHDTPGEPDPYDIEGWLDDGRHVLIKDRYDIWSVDLNGTEAPINITNGFGRINRITFNYQNLDPDADFIKRKELLYLSAFNEQTKAAGYFTVKLFTGDTPHDLLMGDCSYGRGITKAKNADRIIWQKETFTESPELYVSNINFSDPERLSVTNPQQGKYNWGTVELVEWMSFDHQELQGLLYKPEDFDPSRKYPMIVYFYERNSDGLHSYIPPAPGRSKINITFAVSNGYILFVPDITYTTGYPGQSCYNAVVSGTYSMIDKYPFIDSDHMGLDGQSWGGYQIAYLVTQTDLYKCAYSGAPVVNMISAYGGIRWESGMSRMFQYEQTQSRIGGTLWEKPIHYIENSPIFFIPKINTPLLIMHNDADGAVPWYQGIEFINALRRLEKPAWMLSYNDEAHNLVKRPNGKDIMIRKMQFFDHYLKDQPMPYWMKNGISQLEKGKIDGYELVKN